METQQNNKEHTPVLLQEIIDQAPDGLEVMMDFTLGRAGHSLALLEAHPKMKLYASDRDQEAIAAAKEILTPYQDRVELFWGTFVEAAEHWAEKGLKADLILADLGVSSPQLDKGERGFSFLKPGPLDMRMDGQRGLTALGLIRQSSEKELAEILFRLGEESFGRKIAQKMKEKEMELELTTDLARLAEEVIPRKLWPKKIHPATKTFQALRMAVNEELQEIEGLLKASPDLLNPKGRCMIISFHSLEDRLVKRTFRHWVDPCTCPKEIPYCCCGAKPLAKLLQKKPVIATKQETLQNPRARSAKLRIAVRL